MLPTQTGRPTPADHTVITRTHDADDARARYRVSEAARFRAAMRAHAERDAARTVRVPHPDRLQVPTQRG